MFTPRRWWIGLVCLFLANGGAPLAHAAPTLHLLDAMETTNCWHGQGVALAVSEDCVEGRGALRLTGSGHVRLTRDALQGLAVGAYDRLVMNVKMVGGQVADFGVVVAGFPQPGALAFPRWAEYDEGTPADRWLEYSVDLHLCEWNGGHATLLDDRTPALSLLATPGRNNRGVLVDHVRLIRDPVRLAYDWVAPMRPLRVRREGERVYYEKEIALSNVTAQPVSVALRFGPDSIHRFTGSLTPSALELRPGEQRVVRARIEPPAGARSLEHERQTVEIVPDQDERLVQRVAFLTAAPFPAVAHPFTPTAAPPGQVERLLDLPLPDRLPRHPFVWLSQSTLNTWTPCLAGFDRLDAKTGEIQEQTHISGGIWHRQLVEWAWKLGQAYQATRDVRYAEKARQIYLLYAQAYRHYPLQEPLSQASSALAPNNATYVLGTVIMTPIARGLDLIWESGVLSDEDREAIREGLLLPAALEMMKIHPGLTNMQDAMNDALLTLGLLLNDPNLTAEALFGSHGLSVKIDAAFDEDGATPESVSPGYHAAALNPILAQAASIRRTGLAVNLPFERLEKAKRLMAQLRMPDGRIPHRGDTAFPGGKTDAELATYGSMTFRHYGLSILREGEGSNALYVALDHRPPAVTHSHHDKLSIVLYGLGHDFGTDEGSLYNADSSKQEALPNWNTRQAWGTHALVHNTLTVDEADQAYCGGTLLYFHGEKGAYQAVAAATDDAYPGVILERHIIVLGGLVAMADRCLSDQPHTYDWTHHSFGALTGPDALAPCAQLGSKPPYTLPENVRWGRVEGPAHFIWKRDQAAMRLTLLPEANVTTECATAVGWANQAYRLARQEAPLVLARRHGARVVFVTLFEPFAGEAPTAQRIERVAVLEDGRPAAAEDAVGLKITRPTETLYYLFSFTPTEKTCGPIRTRERCFAVRCGIKDQP